MGQKWRKIRRRCSSFNTGSTGGKSKATDDNQDRCGYGGGGGQDRGPLLAATSSDDSSASLPSPPSATTVHDMLRSRLNMLSIGYKRRPQLQHHQHQQHREIADTTSTFYVPSPLLRTDGNDDHGGGGADDDGPCSLPAAFDLQPSADQHRLLQPSSLCRVAADTPSSCGSSGRGTADDGAGSDRSSVSYSDHGYNSIVSTAACVGYDSNTIDR